MTGFDELIEGYRRFRSERWASEQPKWRELAEGQNPRALVIACCDSRADPAIIFDVDPGEIFVVRNIANLVPPFEEGGGRHGVSAALEFAVTQLEVPEIIVMGHERCGGIQAALTGQFRGAAAGEGGFVERWIEGIRPCSSAIVKKYGTGAEAARLLEEEAIRQSLSNLRTFPFVNAREKAASLSLHGCHFSISEGRLYLLDGAEGEFRPI